MKHLIVLTSAALALGTATAMDAEAQASDRGTAKRRGEVVVRQIPSEAARRQSNGGNRRDDDNRSGRGNDDRYGRGNDDRYGRGNDDGYRRDDDSDRRRDDDWWENRRDRDRDWVIARRGNDRGPAFCRSGAGHPVYGRYWCVQRGYGLGRDSRWDRVRWDGVIFRRDPRYNRDLGRDVLIDILGSGVYGRLDARRRYFGISRPLVGRWMISEGRPVLVVSAGGMPLAELVDFNHDRRVDLILVNFGR